MPVKKVAICDVCGWQADFDDAKHGTWISNHADKFFIINIAHVYCSEKCYQKKGGVK